jgi:hypothetical protein
MTPLSNAEKQARFRKKEYLKQHADKVFQHWVLSPMRFRFCKRSEQEVRQSLDKAIALPYDWNTQDYDYALKRLGEFELDLRSSVDQIANDVDGVGYTQMSSLATTDDPFKWLADNKAEIQEARRLADHLISILIASNCSDTAKAAALMETKRFLGRSLTTNPKIHQSEATAMCLVSISQAFSRPNWFPETLAKAIQKNVDTSTVHEIARYLTAL